MWLSFSDSISLSPKRWAMLLCSLGCPRGRALVVDSIFLSPKRWAMLLCSLGCHRGRALVGPLTSRDTGRSCGKRGLGRKTGLTIHLLQETPSWCIFSWDENQKHNGKSDNENIWKTSYWQYIWIPPFLIRTPDKDILFNLHKNSKYKGLHNCVYGIYVILAIEKVVKTSGYSTLTAARK